MTGDYSEQAKLRDRSAPGTVERLVEIIIKNYISGNIAHFMILTAGSPHRAADDLHRALTAAVGDGSPVLLVGVEYSSMVARFYTQVYGQ